MPSKSPAQSRLMRAVAKSLTFAKKVHIPQAVGREYYAEDKKKAKGEEPSKWSEKRPRIVNGKVR